MTPPNAPDDAAAAAQAAPDATPSAAQAELVKAVADRVYALFLRDLRLERERQGRYGSANIRNRTAGMQRSRG